MKMIAVLCSALVLVGCATRGANYVPLVDLKDKDAEKWSTDVTECQAYARERMDGQKGAMVGAVIGALLGAAIAPRGHASEMAGYGAGVGAVSGGANATMTQEGITKQCLTGRGYNVLN